MFEESIPSWQPLVTCHILGLYEAVGCWSSHLWPGKRTRLLLCCRVESDQRKGGCSMLHCCSCLQANNMHKVPATG